MLSSFKLLHFCCNKQWTVCICGFVSVDSTNYSLKSIQRKGWGYSSVVQLLPSMCEALGLIPQHYKNRFREDNCTHTEYEQTLFFLSLFSKESNKTTIYITNNLEMI
jgi:hypothetical protein